jgi:hypothetical protein
MRITRLSSKGQLTLNKTEWAALGLQPHDPIVLEVVRGALRLRRAPGAPRRDHPPAQPWTFQQFVRDCHRRTARWWHRKERRL